MLKDVAPIYGNSREKAEQCLKKAGWYAGRKTDITAAEEFYQAIYPSRLLVAESGRLWREMPMGQKYSFDDMCSLIAFDINPEWNRGAMHQYHDAEE